MDVGLELRQARERCGISLQQLSQSTKITPRILQALERGDADAFPAPVYTRGFVRSYAREVGLPEDEFVRRYMAQLEPPVPEEVIPPRVEPGPVPTALRISIRGEAARALLASVTRGPIAVGSAVAVVAIVVFALRAPQQTPSPAHAPVAAAGLAGAAAEGVPVATTGAMAHHGLHIEIAPTAACWVRATVEGQRMFAVLMKAGERRSMDVSSEIDLRLGDAAACAMTINGTAARVGAPGQPLTLHITTGNYAQFLTR